MAVVPLRSLLITYFEVLLGELVPKSLALQRAERIALAVAGPMDVFIRLTRPAVKLMNVSATLVLRLFQGAAACGEAGCAFAGGIEAAGDGDAGGVGLLPAFQEEMIHRALEISNNVVGARDHDAPRGKIFCACRQDMPLELASARIIDEQHSRIPVFDPSRMGPDDM